MRHENSAQEDYMDFKEETANIHLYASHFPLCPLSAAFPIFYADPLCLSPPTFEK